MRLPSSLLLSAAFALTGGTSAANEQWLASGLLPLEPEMFEVAEVKITRNHVEQEILRAVIRRVGSGSGRNPAADLRLVMLPAHGGRYAVHAGRTLIVSPRREDVVGGVVGGMLSYRGHVALGARVYLEMHQSARRPGATTSTKRVSKVYWLGTDEQLAAAVKKGPPPSVRPGDKLKSRMVAVSPSLPLPKGMFIKVPVGGHVRPVTVWEDAAANQPVTGLVYLTRPGGLLLPWIATLKREGIKAESEALDELQSNPGFFADRYQAVQARVLKGKAPPKLLESAVGKEIVVGQRLLTFKLRSLHSMEVLAPVLNGTVKVRGGRLKKESELALAALYLDPDADKTLAAAAEPAKRPAQAKSAGTKSGWTKAASRYRTWTDATGEFKVDAMLVKVVDGSITLRRRDRKEITVPLARLSEADRKFVEGARTENPFDPK